MPGWRIVLGAGPGEAGVGAGAGTGAGVGVGVGTGGGTGTGAGVFAVTAVANPALFAEIEALRSVSDCNCAGVAPAEDAAASASLSIFAMPERAATALASTVVCAATVSVSALMLSSIADMIFPMWLRTATRAESHSAW